MRLLYSILVLPVFSLSSVAAPLPDKPPDRLCTTTVNGGAGCQVSKKDLQEAKHAFKRGLKLQGEKQIDDALAEFETAAKLVPQSVDYATAKEFARQQAIFQHVQDGNNALQQGKRVEALASFRNALHLDPTNEFARQRATDALGESAPRTAAPAQVVESGGEIRVEPKTEPMEFHFRGDARELLTRVAQAYGLTPIFHDSVLSRRVRFDLDKVDFETAMNAACNVTKTFWTPLQEKQIFLAADTPDNHRQFDRMALTTFYIPSVNGPQDLSDIVNSLRTIFGISFVTQKPITSTITVRAPQRALDVATEFLEGLDASKQQVLLDVRLYEISSTLTRNMGLSIPNQFTVFNIPAGALAALGGQNAQDLINQLIASGGINQAGSTALSALLAQLQNQQNSIFSQPLATFGNGKTLFGVSLGSLTATLQLNESTVKQLEQITLRAAEGKDAKLNVGSRFPIVNASFAPVFNTSAISKVIGNNSFQAPFPSFSYEDLGFSVKAKPQVHGNLDVTLDLEIQLRSLGATSLNGVPIINNREYKSAITLKDGEPAVVAGSISRTEQFSITGIPGLGYVPALNKISANNTRQDDEDELLLVVTPHVVGTSATAGSEIWMPSQ